MRKPIAALALAGALGLGGAVALTPAVAVAQQEDSGTTGRLAALKEALKGLVSDGTIDQAQADKVAATLAEKLPPRAGHGPRGRGHGPGGRHGMHLAGSAAEALGITEQELRAAHDAGKSLADIAAEKGISREDLIDRLAQAGAEKVDELVASGELTQEQGERRKERLRGFLEQMVDRKHGERPSA